MRARPRPKLSPVNYENLVSELSKTESEMNLINLAIRHEQFHGISCGCCFFKKFVSTEEVLVSLTSSPGPSCVL